MLNNDHPNIYFRPLMSTLNNECPALSKEGLITSSSPIQTAADFEDLLSKAQRSRIILKPINIFYFFFKSWLFLVEESILVIVEENIFTERQEKKTK